MQQWMRRIEWSNGSENSRSTPVGVPGTTVATVIAFENTPHQPFGRQPRTRTMYSPGGRAITSERSRLPTPCCVTVIADATKGCNVTDAPCVNSTCQLSSSSKSGDGSIH